MTSGSTGCLRRQAPSNALTEFAMRLLFLGDVVGRAGRKAVIDGSQRCALATSSISLPSTARTRPAASASRSRSCYDLLDAGADVVTLGNHAFDQKEALVFIERQPQLDTPHQLSTGHAGQGQRHLQSRQRRRRAGDQRHGTDLHAGAGRSRSAPSMRKLTACGLKKGADAIVIDFHAEATSEKQALGHFVDGRASCVVGTHTHAPTADERVLPGGTAYDERCRHVRGLRVGPRHGRRTSRSTAS